MTQATVVRRPIAEPPNSEWSRGRRDRRWRFMALGMIGALVVLSFVYLLFGVGNILSPAEAWRALVDPETAPKLHAIAMDARAPRLVLALLAGAALGSSGALLQALTRNPLASPELTGVTAGAVTAAVAWVAFAPPIPLVPAQWGRPASASLGAFAAVIVVYLLTRRSGQIESTRLLLMGILVGGVLNSLTTLSLLFLGSDAQRILNWLSGSLALKTWTDALLVLAYVIPGFVMLLFAIPRANALQLGDDVARSLGQRKEADRLVVLIGAVILAAGVVAIIGAIGFVGLMAPHMVRGLVGSDLRRLVPASALAGAGMVTVADLITRNVSTHWIFFWLEKGELQSSTLPTGVVLTLFGVPYLASLLWRQNR